jgi:hypothetical protein
LALSPWSAAGAAVDAVRSLVPEGRMGDRVVGTKTENQRFRQ